jgi:hypothetical protein
VDTEEYEGVTALPRLVYGAAWYTFAGPLAGVVWKDGELALALDVALEVVEDGMTSVRRCCCCVMVGGAAYTGYVDVG